MTELTLITNAHIVDGSSPEPTAERHVLIEDGLIREVSDVPLSAEGARVIDAHGRTLMPGLIDCHAHVVGTQMALGPQSLLPDSLITARSIHIMKGMLMRGFTTIRDVGGCDNGLRQAVNEGLIAGPRLFICGKSISQTGGHADLRGPFDFRDKSWMPRKLGSLGRVADGVEGLRYAIREEIKGGADFVKIMGSGGVASPTDPVSFLGYSMDELRAAVDEASMAQTYVAAHLYTSESIRRAVTAGVRSVEHANLIDRETAELVAQHNAIVVPTIVVFDSLARDGEKFGLPKFAIDKIADVRGPSRDALAHLQAAGVTMAYGTDLLGEGHACQSDEFLIRAEVLPAHEVIAAATLNAAKLLRQDGKLGCIAPGAHADMLLVDGNPLADLSLLTGQGAHMPLIMKGGVDLKNTLN